MALAPNGMEPLGRRVGLHPSRGTDVRQGVNGCWRSKVAEYGLEPVSKARQTGLRQTDLAKENESIHAGNKQTCHIVKILEGIFVFEKLLLHLFCFKSYGNIPVSPSLAVLDECGQPTNRTNRRFSSVRMQPFMHATPSRPAFESGG